MEIKTPFYLRIMMICSKCVLDETIEDLILDADGVCNYCSNYKIRNASYLEKSEKDLDLIFDRIKVGNNSFDCIIGLSGGIDSAYTAYLAYKKGLKALCIHVDAGWNSEAAVYNIERIIEYTSFELHTVIVNWESVKELQRALFLSGLANQDAIQDHIFFSELYSVAKEKKIRYVLSGGNYVSEGVFPKTWHHPAGDSILLKDVYKKFGRGEPLDFKYMNFWENYIYYPYVFRMNVIRPLNYVSYNPKGALEELISQLGYRNYGVKHSESTFTRYFQNYWIVKRFGYDKRKAHLSSLIHANLITRKEALDILRCEIVYPQFLEDENYIKDKLDLSSNDWEYIMNRPLSYYTEFKNWDYIYSAVSLLKKVLRFF
jgi:N-acetyl sugar amidotransferase